MIDTIKIAISIQKFIVLGRNSSIEKTITKFIRNKIKLLFIQYIAAINYLPKI